MLFRSEQRYFLSVLVSGHNSAANVSMIIELTEAERSEFNSTEAFHRRSSSGDF